ncbi:low molecular weight protein-tyrosine-phosphatase [Stenotrophomonas sp. YIM B06876]|uniref:low molecular weight protein-tyrosine-phosphatase n=1 Tax=Stenotrophomonas sp. YIM B06876 TaxID=3060211 RepID=UPI00273A5154|nr:low molecular weight protein-tyrosine-phosphatase [Stenotrophomonas sp. YIM B06876]
MFKSILFVCVGNICRSPTAEVVMRHHLARDGVQMGSAGLQALAGKPIDPMAQQILQEHQLDGSMHRGRQLTAALLRETDLVLVMERRHVASITNEFPQASGKTFLLGKWCGDREIPDPYRQQRPAFEHVYALIDECTQAWTRYIR